MACSEFAACGDGAVQRLRATARDECGWSSSTPTDAPPCGPSAGRGRCVWQPPPRGAARSRPARERVRREARRAHGPAARRFARAAAPRLRGTAPTVHRWWHRTCAIKAERVAFDLKRSLQRLEVEDVETITRRAPVLPEVRRGGKAVDPESLLRHENRHDERLTGLPRRNTPDHRDHQRAYRARQRVRDQSSPAVLRYARLHALDVPPAPRARADPLCGLWPG